jgi:pimeloyl-ACP methyl ester carboxylesterase
MPAGMIEEMDLDGCTVHVRRWQPVGRRTTAAPMLLVHGLGANTISWLPVGRALAERRGAEVIAIDLVGFGYTRAVDTPATLNRNADLVVAALEQFGPSVVVGNSMGGAITVKVAARRPDLVEAMVLVNPAVRAARLRSPQFRTGVFMAPMLFPRVGERVIAARAGQLGPEGLVDGTLQTVLERLDELDTSVRDEFITIARDRMEFPEAARAYADAASSLFWYMTRNLDRDLAVALRSLPGLLVFGDRDRLIHVSSAQALAERHPTLAVEMLEGIGHAPQLDAPDVFVDAVTGWLDPLSGRAAAS